ncbi:MAG: nucleotidyltransferase substrate binding protein [Clostridia bacterium]|nr:nucleotidyltransferase substrate binding protein [Clostridia bacterium]
MSTYYGLTKSDFYKLVSILERHATDIASAILFGSRARGDFKPFSDIDIAIKFRSNHGVLATIIEEFESLDIIYTFDCIDYDYISNPKLKTYVDEEGKMIFATNGKGEPIMNPNKIIDKHLDLKKALNKLKESCSRDPYKDDIVLDATIQRFEFTYELAWKLMKIYLEYNGNNEALSPRSAIRESYKIGLITDGDLWIQMLGDRNRTSHTYDEACAFEIFEHVSTLYVHTFEDFIAIMETKLSTLTDY